MAAPRAAARAVVATSDVSGERPKVQNRRALHRIAVRLSAVLICDSRLHEARIINLTSGGALIECGVPVPTATQVVVVLSHWTGQLRLAASVRWNAGRTCGVEFTELGRRERYAVAELLENTDSKRPSRIG